MLLPYPSSPPFSSPHPLIVTLGAQLSLVASFSPLCGHHRDRDQQHFCRRGLLRRPPTLVLAMSSIFVVGLPSASYLDDCGPLLCRVLLALLICIACMRDQRPARLGQSIFDHYWPISTRCGQFLRPPQPLRCRGRKPPRLPRSALHRGQARLGQSIYGHYWPISIRRG